MAPPSSAVIFDLDGTLADSAACVVDTMNAALVAAGLAPAAPAAVRAMVGLPLSVIVDRLVGAGVPSARRRAVADGYRALYPGLAASSERCFPGAVALLDSLRAGGRQLAIATGKSQLGADVSTERLGIRHRFDQVHGILPGTPGKPHPALLHRVIAALGCRPSDAVVVGDTVFDLEMARAVGVRTCAVTWGVHPREALAAAAPDDLVSTFEELAAALAR